MIFDVRGTYDTISIIKEVVDTTKYNEVICLVDDFEYRRLLKELDKSEEKWGFNFTSERIVLEIGAHLYRECVFVGTILWHVHQ